MAYVALYEEHLAHNIDYFANLLKDKNRVCVALKDNAYGHGINEIGALCAKYQVKHAFVSDQAEANIVHKYGYETVLVLHDIPSKRDDRSYYAINSIESIDKFPKHQKVELKINTGMNRNGIAPEQIEQALKRIQKNSLVLQGVFTHFCCADESNNKTKQQERLFDECIDTIKSLWDADFRVHCANSAGAHKVDSSKYDIARIGIGIYGYVDLSQFQRSLKPVMAVYAYKLSTQVVHQDESVGYGSKAYISKEKVQTISCYDFGYGKGFLRLGEEKKSTIEDGRAVLGRVSMDSFSVIGDDIQVCVFHDASRFAKIHNTIVYEVLTSISPFLKRKVLFSTTSESVAQ